MNYKNKISPVLYMCLVVRPRPYIYVAVARNFLAGVLILRPHLNSEFYDELDTFINLGT